MKKIYYVYVIKGKNRYYAGSTTDIAQRLKEHNSGKTKSLKNKGPFNIIHLERFLSKTEAIKREHKIKSFKGGNAFKKLIQAPSSSLV